MNAPVVEVFGVLVRSPVSAATNLVLALQCAMFAGMLWSRAQAGGRWWAGFFLASAVAAAFGAPKHGIPHLLPEMAFTAVHLVSNLALAGGVVCLQWSVVEWLGPGGARRVVLRRAVWSYAVAVVLINAWTVDFGATGLAVAVGMAPVFLLEVHAAIRDSRPGSEWIAVGFAVAVCGALAHAAGLQAGPWVDGTDMAHFAFILGNAALYLGSRIRFASNPGPPVEPTSISHPSTGILPWN